VSRVNPGLPSGQTDNDDDDDDDDDDERFALWLLCGSRLDDAGLSAIP